MSDTDPASGSETTAAARGSGRPPATLIVGVIAAVAVLGSVAYMIVTTVRSGDALEYYLDVDEALRSAARLEGRVLRLHGNVVAGTIQKKPGSLDYRFALFRKGRWVEVIYRGLVPDAFKDCAEVVVTGRLRSGSEQAAPLLRASRLTAKCPSKYEDRRARAGTCGEQLRAAVRAARRASDRRDAR